MKACIVSCSDEGGAGRAALRLNKALRGAGLDSSVFTDTKTMDDPSVIGPRGARRYIKKPLRRKWASRILDLSRCDDPAVRSLDLFDTPMPRRLTKADPDIINLHWIGAETISVRQVAQLTKPVVWTLHDMWAFCGAEHYADDGKDARWRHGYSRASRIAGSRGFDVDRWTFLRKQKHWRQPMQVVTPSSWLARCVSESSLMQGWPVTVIPNALDTDLFKPLDRRFARAALGLPQEDPIVLFGAMGVESDPRKGFCHLRDALHVLKEESELRAHCVVFGACAPASAPDLGFPAIWMGRLHDDWSLALLYSAADVMVVPSTQENLPQAATEAQSCGCPVVAFGVTGFPDTVVHGETGYLARPFEARDLAHGIRWVIETEAQDGRLGRAARARAETLWSEAKIARQYAELFERIPRS